MTKRESLRKPHPDSSYCCRSSEKQVWALKRNWIITRGRKSESDTCLRAHVVLGLCGGLRRVAEGVRVDRGAGDGTLGRGRLELRDSGVVPSGCLIQVAANTHNKPEHICVRDVTATWWIGSTRHTWPQTCSTCTTRCARASALGSRTARLVLPWPLTGRASRRAANETDWNRRLRNPLERFLLARDWSVRPAASGALFLLSFYFECFWVVFFLFFFEEGLWQEWK